MQPTILAAFLEFSRTAFSMAAAGVALLVIGVLAAKNDIAEARGVNKIVASSNLCFAIPLAVFGALHLFGPRFVIDIVPPYMPFDLTIRLTDEMLVSPGSTGCRTTLRPRPASDSIARGASHTER